MMIKEKKTYTKQEIRDEIRKKKRSMSKQEISDCSRIIFEKLETLDVWKHANTVYTYVSYNQEVETKTRLEQWLLDGKKVAVPRVEGDEINFYYISELSELTSGYQGIEEPGTDTEALEDGIILMPGLAFDKDMHRCGYGGGYYDKYLKKNQGRNYVKIALAFDFQIVDVIPVDAYDVPVDMIVSEERIISSDM